MRKLVWILSFLIVCALGVDFAGATSVEVDLRLGFGPDVPESWIPVAATITNAGPAFSGELAFHIPRENVSTGSSHETIYTIPITIASNAAYTVHSVIYYERDSLSPLTATLTSGSETLWTQTQHPTRYHRQQTVILAITQRFGAYDFLQQTPGIAVLYLAPDDMPREWLGYYSVDAVLVDDVDIATIGDQRLEALVTWAALGKPVIVLGTNLAASGDSRFFDLVFPGQLVASISRTIGDFQFEVGKVHLTSGRVVWEEQGIPLVVSRTVGGGEFYFVLFDPLSPRLRGWSARNDVLTALLTTHRSLPFLIPRSLNTLADQFIEVLPQTTFGRAWVFALLLVYCGCLALWFFVVAPTAKRLPVLPGIVVITVCFVAFFALLFGHTWLQTTDVLLEVAVLKKLPTSDRALVEGTFTLAQSEADPQRLELSRTLGGLRQVGGPSSLTTDLRFWQEPQWVRFQPAAPIVNWQATYTSQLPLYVDYQLDATKETVQLTIDNAADYSIVSIYLFFQGLWYPVGTGGDGTFAITLAEHRPFPTWRLRRTGRYPAQRVTAPARRLQITAGIMALLEPSVVQPLAEADNALLAITLDERVWSPVSGSVGHREFLGILLIPLSIPQ